MCRNQRQLEAKPKTRADQSSGLWAADYSANMWLFIHSIIITYLFFLSWFENKRELSSKLTRTLILRSSIIGMTPSKTITILSPCIGIWVFVSHASRACEQRTQHRTRLTQDEYRPKTSGSSSHARVLPMFTSDVRERARGSNKTGWTVNEKRRVFSFPEKSWAFSRWAWWKRLSSFCLI